MGLCKSEIAFSTFVQKKSGKTRRPSKKKETKKMQDRGIFEVGRHSRETCILF